MKHLVNVFLFILLTNNLVQAQCSDAGICSIGDISSLHLVQENYRFSADYLYGYSGSDDDVQFHTLVIMGEYSFDRSLSLSIKWNAYNRQIGPLGTVTGMGDLIIMGGYSFLQEPGQALRAEMGTRIASGDANADPELPQIYQPGLGTNDILAGISYQIKDLGISAGYQFVQRINNDNAIMRLKRGDDIYLQGTYRFPFKDGEFVPTIQAIKRLQKSEILDDTGSPVVIPDSDQMQINLGGMVSYELFSDSEVTLRAAVPILKRDVNVDGLTRKFSFSVGFRQRF